MTKPILVLPPSLVPMAEKLLGCEIGRMDRFQIIVAPRVAATAQEWAGQFPRTMAALGKPPHGGRK